MVGIRELIVTHNLGRWTRARPVRVRNDRRNSGRGRENGRGRGSGQVEGQGHRGKAGVEVGADQGSPLATGSCSSWQCWRLVACCGDTSECRTERALPRPLPLPLPLPGALPPQPARSPALSRAENKESRTTL